MRTFKWVTVRPTERERERERERTEEAGLQGKMARGAAAVTEMMMNGRRNELDAENFLAEPFVRLKKGRAKPLPLGCASE